jgi:transcriptional regulator with GAF, ATPase, and Fis domain
MTSSPLGARMADAARALADQGDPLHTLQEAVNLAVRLVPWCDAAGISMVRAKRHVETPAASDDSVVVADELQYQTAQGPCLDAIWEERTVYSPSIGYDDRWPRWGPMVVAETDFQSTLSFQLYTAEDTLGALNLYARSKDGFSGSDREVGTALAAHVALSLSGALKVEHYRQAMETRASIGQAVGILREKYDLDEEAAFAVLVRLSSASNVKLREIAAQVIRTRALPDGVPGPP